MNRTRKENASTLYVIKYMSESFMNSHASNESWSKKMKSRTLSEQCQTNVSMIKNSINCLFIPNHVVRNRKHNLYCVILSFEMRVKKLKTRKATEQRNAWKL